MPPWSPGNTVVVLGAGASRGAEFVEKAQPLCEPPLNADFFTQLQRITTPRHQKTITAVLADVLTLHGPDFDLTLEQYFTQIEAMLTIVRDSRGGTGKYTLAELQLMRSRLLEALSAVLEESADVAKQRSPGHATPCGYHAELVEALKPKDTVISFNYDCVVDHALRTSATSKWSARYGYGFPNPARVEGHALWDADDPPTQQSKTINLLKLHGSINWYPFPPNDTDAIRLRQKPYKQAGQKLYEIIPPEYVKSVGTRPIFPALWAHAALALRRAKVIVFVGFSFTPTDLHVEALFRLSLSEKKDLRNLVIVNPAAEHRKRIRSIVAPALRDGTRAVQFETFRKASSYLPSLLA